MQCFSQTLLPQTPLIEARFLWVALPPLLTSLWVGVEQLLWPLGLQSWGTSALLVDSSRLHIPDLNWGHHILKQ